MKKSPYQSLIFERCALADRRALLRLLRRWQKQPSDTSQQALEQAISLSMEQVALRQNNRPNTHLNQQLPFYDKRDELKQLIAEHQVVIVCGETGSGKTTQIPQLCLELGLADRGKIGHTQPRRLAARAVSARIAEELNTEPGTAVGYKVRFSDQTQADSVIKLMTDGILLAEIQSDRWLNEYQTLIIDEAHERSLNIDLILGYLKTLLPKRPDLKLIITSATIDPERFSRYFNDAPMMMVSGRTYPVEIRYRPIQDEEQKERDRLNGVMDALDELFSESPQDTLVFFPGERQIREAAERISKRFHNYLVLPLYARLSNEQQQQIFKRNTRPKIILSTNVAETSLTVPGIRYVIDTGLARISRYSWRARVQRLPIEKISRASANQRAGRCGRVADGICIRLYDEEDFNLRDEFTEAEILRTNLASVILQMDNLGFGDVREFDFIDPPDSRLISDGFRLLQELQAVTDQHKVTKLGRLISRLSIDPRLARMLLAAAEKGCIKPVLAIASVLSVQDPRMQSEENRQAAREKYSQWQHPKSDFLSWVNLWTLIKQQKKELSRNHFAKWCKQQHLSYLRIREWQDIYNQVRDQLKEMGFATNNDNDDDEQWIHRSILTGIPSHIAQLDQDQLFQSTRGRQVTIFPSSVLANKKPKWIMAFSLIDTSRLYAHDVAAINPQWAVEDLQHLHQYDYYQPWWQIKQARVAALRNTRIYGLLIEGGRRVNYARINPKQSREIFIREALVEGQFKTSVNFIKENRKLIEFYRKQEERERRRDLLISDQQLFDFYDQYLPEHCVDGVSFHSWAKTLDADQIKQLTLFKQDVLATDHDKDTHAYPETIQLKNQTLKLSYVFDPADEADGVTVWIPLAVLNQFEDDDFDRLVPGLLEEKVEALLRCLPKRVRKNFIPISEFACACIDTLQPGKPLLPQITFQLKRMTGVSIQPDDWQLEQIDGHLLMRYCVEQNGQCIASGRSLADLQQQYGGHARDSFEQELQQDNEWAREGLVDWDFDQLPEQVVIRQQGSRITAFPALVDYQQSVSIELLETREDADFYHATGIARLIYFHLHDSIKYLKKNLPQIQHTALMYASLGTQQELIDDILVSSIFDCFLQHQLPRDRQQFEQRLSQQREAFISVANDKAKLVNRALTLFRQARQQIGNNLIPARHRDDIDEQMDYLIYPGFIRATETQWLQRYPAYFQALIKRIEKFQHPNSQMDSNLVIVRDLWTRYLQMTDTVSDSQALESIRWMIEEFRISCFAQPMKTQYPVSENKIRKRFDVL